MYSQCRSTTIPIIDYESLIKQDREEIREKDIESNEKEALTNNQNRSINEFKEVSSIKEAITDSLEYTKREYKIIVNKNAMAVSLFIDKDNKDPVNIIRAKYQGITMNSLLFKNYEEVTESLKIQVNGKWHPVGCDTVKAVFDHEFEHQLDIF